MNKSYLDNISDENMRLVSIRANTHEACEETQDKIQSIHQKSNELMDARLDASYELLVFSYFKLKNIARKSAKNEIEMVDAYTKLNNFRVQHSFACLALTLFVINNGGLLYNAALLAAHDSGVEINTEKDDALESAQWQRDNTRYEQHPLNLLDEFRLSDLTESELRENASQYPEFGWELPEDEIEQARIVLASTALTHSTISTSLVAGIQDVSSDTQILPHRILADQGRIHSGALTDVDPALVQGFTFRVDKAMGLDEYVFMRFALPYTDNLHQKPVSVILLSPDILLDEKCVVTTNDIMYADIDDNIGVESQQQLDAIKEYRSSAILGSDWLEIMARRIAKHKIENPDQPLFPLDSIADEVKFHGPVPRSMVVDVIEPEDVKKYIDLVGLNYEC